MEVKTKIKQFWSWFVQNQEVLKPDRINNKLIEVLNQKILSLGDLNWEIGAGTKKENMLIISPGGDIDLLPLTKAVVSSSPMLADWEFYDHKPAKDWEYQFYIEEKGVKKMIDVSDWEYVLLKFPDNTYDLLIKCNNLRAYVKDQQYDLVDIALESILGEELSLKLIKNVDIIKDFSREHLDQKSNIKHLKNHILELGNLI